jgi:hypothetical protein
LTEENPGAFIASPVVLPRGRAVMYGVIGGGVERVAVFDLDSREEKIIVENGQNAFYSDTGHVVFARGTTIMAAPFRVAELAVTGEPVAMIENVRHPNPDIVATEYAEFDPSLSPDGRWLAYSSNRTGRPEIWGQGYPNGVAMRVSSNGGFEPRWSADGRELYYLQANAVMGVAVQPGDDFSFSAPEQLFAGPYLQQSNPLISSYDVASDGRFLMIELLGGLGANAPARHRRRAELDRRAQASRARQMST